MYEDTIQRIEARLRSSENIPDTTRAELLNLVATLRAEVSQLPPAQSEQAHNIARAAEASTSEALSSNRNPDTQRGTLDELAESVREFEGTHPRLVQIVNNFANTLSGLGI